jgi:hypothetical protein
VRASRLVGVGLSALLVAAGVALYVHFHRFDGGPLKDPSYGGSSGATTVGHATSFPIHLDKSGTGKITLEKVSFLKTTGASYLRAWVLARNNVGQLVGGPFPPTDTKPSDLRHVHGYVMTGSDAWLAVEIRATKPGCVGFSGLEIEYRAGWRRYRRVARGLTERLTTPGIADCSTALPGKVSG